MNSILRLFGKFWGCLAIWIMLAAPVPAAQDVAQNPSPATVSVSQGQAPAPTKPNSQTLTYKRFHRVLAQNLTSNLFSRTNLFPFIAGSAGALAIAPADQEISDALRGHADGYGDAGNIVGGVVNASIVGGAVLAGRFTHNEHFRSFGYTLAQAYATNVILTQGIKYASHRMRPDQSKSTSFPSGHTSDSFAIATVISGYYGKKWGIPLYGLAALIGVSRIEQGRHWASDVVAGAALGYISGQTAIRGTRRELSRNQVTFRIVPVWGRDVRGISLRIIQ